MVVKSQQAVTIVHNREHQVCHFPWQTLCLRMFLHVLKLMHVDFAKHYLHAMVSSASRNLSCSAVRCRSGTNNSAMFAEIVPEQLRSAVYAFDRSFEGAVGATGAPLVGKYSMLL